jgi:hypothetical protein
LKGLINVVNLSFNTQIDGRIILRRIFRKWDVGLWTGFKLAQGRDRWKALVNAVMNFRVP